MKRKILAVSIVVVVALALPVLVFAGLQWADNFDSYATGANLHGLGGWKGWANDPGATAFTTDVQALSPANSVDISATADLVHEYTGYTSGQWLYTAWQYIPGNFSGTSYFILLNTYSDAGTNNWSTQVQFDSATGNIISDFDGATMPFVTDQWSEIQVLIDLDANTQTFWYNGAELYTKSWTDGVSGGGAVNIGAVDLYANGATSVYYDDLSLMPALNIDFTKTVGLDANACAATSEISVPSGYGGTDVTYCYNLDNTGLYTVSFHTVEDTELGTLLGPDAVLDVAPGDSYFFTATVLITQTTVNTATWTITNDQGGQIVAEDTDSATVTVLPPTSVSLSGFVGDSSGTIAPLWVGLVLLALVGFGLVLRRRAMA